MKRWTNFFCLLVFLSACKRDAPFKEEVDSTVEVPSSLPMQPLSLNDLSAFAQPTATWEIKAAAFGELQKPFDLQAKAGAGVLVNANAANTATQLSTTMQHGDLEMELDFLLPQNGQALILLQGRYAIQLQDTWQKNENTCGMLLGNAEASNQLAPVNACRAPGLWQHLRFYFQAPRFDSNGTKTSPAKILYLSLNDYTLFSEIELLTVSTGATDAAEVAEGPLVFSTLAGPIAFQNIKYKAYSLQRLQLENIQYKMYRGNWDKLPSLDTLPVAESGTRENLSVELESQADKYALAFSADLNVPIDGQYLFETHIDDGGDLLIDGKLVVHNDGEPGYGVERSLVNLTAGIHPMTMTYYQDVWGKTLLIYYEGPGIYRQTLGAPEMVKRGRERKPLVVNPTDGPELIRGFVNYKGVKRNFPISVGSPLGIHYSYDLEEGTLLQAWRGDFADVTEMWVGRGESQLLVPGNASTQMSAGVPIAQLSGPSAPWPAQLPDDFAVEGYDLDTEGYPLFRYRLKDAVFTDQILPTPEGYLERSIKLVEGEMPGDSYFRLAEGKIEALESGWFRVDGSYYIDVEGSETTGLDKGQLLVPLAGKSAIRYTLIW
ncbi:MAG: family 16 glycoside hydrolase [Saprospiraceae bacterium]